MKNLLKGLTRILPAYGVFPVIFSFVFNCLVYSSESWLPIGEESVSRGCRRRIECSTRSFHPIRNADSAIHRIHRLLDGVEIAFEYPREAP